MSSLNKAMLVDSVIVTGIISRIEISIMLPQCPRLRKPVSTSQQAMQRPNRIEREIEILHNQILNELVLFFSSASFSYN